MGNCETEQNPAFRSRNNNSTFNANLSLKKDNYLNNINDKISYHTIANNREVYKISRKKTKKPIKISKMSNYGNIPILDNNTNFSTTSKSKGTEPSENYVMSNANLDKFSRLKTLTTQKSESSNNLFTPKKINKILEKDFNKNFIEKKKRIRRKISSSDKVIEIVQGNNLNKENSYTDIKEKRINNNNFFYNNSDFNTINEIEFKCVKTIQGHIDKIVCATELYKGNFATGSYDNTIKIWNLNSTINSEKSIKEEGNVLCLLQIEENMLLSGTNKNNINLWNLINLQLKFTFKGHESWVNALTKINDKNFASCSNDRKILIWDYHKRICINQFLGHVDGIFSLIRLSDGNLCSGGADLSIKIWDSKTGKCSTTLLGHKKWIKCLCQLTNNNIISGSDDKSIKLWSNDRCIYTFLGHTRSVRTLCQINDYLFASGSFDKSIKIWDINNFNCVNTIYGHNDLILFIFRMKNGEIISCSNDHEIKIWKQIIC